MMAKTRSQTKPKLRRGRSEPRTKVAFRLRQGSRKPTTLKRLPLKPDLFQRLYFTTKRQERAKLFVEKANQNPKRYGAFGSDKWFAALLSEINEPGVVLLENVRVWFNLHSELFQNAQVVERTRTSILDQEEDVEHGSSSYQKSDDTETLSWTPSFEIDGHIESDFIHAESPLSWGVFCCDADTPNNVRDDEDDHGLNIDLPNTAEKEPIVDWNWLNDYKVEDLSQLTMNATEIIEDEFMYQVLEDDTEFSPSYSSTSHNYQTSELARLGEQIGIDLLGIDQELLNEVLMELDNFFGGVHVD